MLTQLRRDAERVRRMKVLSTFDREQVAQWRALAQRALALLAEIDAMQVDDPAWMAIDASYWDDVLNPIDDAMNHLASLIDEYDNYIETETKPE